MRGGIDIIVPCPYCRTPSHLFTGRDPSTGEAWLDHECSRCGGRQVPEVQMALGWARYEAVKGPADIEPLYRHESHWYGKVTGREYHLPEVPEGECGWFPEEAME